jgi:hypothetical protein
MTVSTDSPVYSTRGEVRLTISGIPTDIHTLGVSVTATDPMGGFTRPSLAAWRPAPSTVTSGEEWEAEWEGAIVTGKMVSSESGKETFFESSTPFVAFPGDEINLFGGSVDPSGRVVVRTTRATGFDEVVTTMLGSGDERLRIDVDDPFVGAATLARPMPSFPLEAIDSESVRRESLAMQVQYSYVGDSLAVERRRPPMFWDTPRYSYRMKEWRRFATMREVMIEFVNIVQFRRSARYEAANRWHLWVANPEFDAMHVDALVLLDGIPIFNHDIIFNYNPLLLERIDVYDGRYVLGGNLFFGIVALYTDRNSYPELMPDPYTQILSYPSPQARRVFYAPDYGDPARLGSRLPDFRHTLYWNAEVAATDDGRADVSLFTSDMTGTWQVLVEGVTTSGRPVSATCRLEVR